MQQIARQRRPHLKPVKTQQLRCGFCSVTNKHLLATLHITITYKANTIITFLPSAHHFEMRQRTRVRMVAKIGKWDHGRDAAGVRARSLGRRGMLTRLTSPKTTSTSKLDRERRRNSSSFDARKPVGRYDGLGSPSTSVVEAAFIGGGGGMPDRPHRNHHSSSRREIQHKTLFVFFNFFSFRDTSQ